MKTLDTPKLPFPDFKWKWASLQCTEGINDPVVLLGILFRMYNLEGKYKYSSDEFAKELKSLSNDLVGRGVNIDLRGRTGDRNIIRNSGQYWKALHLIPSDQGGNGIMRLTDFGRKVANHTISQTEFSAITIISLKLPNPNIQPKEECKKWDNAGISIYPLKLILSIIRTLSNNLLDLDNAYLTPFELYRIVIPLSGTANRPVADYAQYIRHYRNGMLDLTSWPNCTKGANDARIAREFLLFLSYYGYLAKTDANSHGEEKYTYNTNLDTEIQEILNNKSTLLPPDLVPNAERKLVYTSSQKRPNQAKFRKEVLQACQRCVISNVEMPEVLEAAHIIPYKYNGEDTAANGFAMRMDIHFLFDSGHLRISENGDVFLSDKARWSYGTSIPPRIFIPEHINRDFIRWRWENYNGA